MDAPGSTTQQAAPQADVVPWADHDEQDVRPYVLTGGRTQPRHPMRLDCVLAAGAVPAQPLAPQADHAVRLCRQRPRSVAELAALIKQPVQVTKVVLSDLIDRSVLTAIPASASADAQPSRQVLETLLTGLRNL